jgi:hypothetical protein
MAKYYCVLQLQMCMWMLGEAERRWPTVMAEYDVDWQLVMQYIHTVAETEVQELYGDKQLLECKDLEAVEEAAGSVKDSSLEPLLIVQRLLEAILKSLGQVLGGEDEVEYEVDDTLRTAIMQCARQRWA